MGYYPAVCTDYFFVAKLGVNREERELPSHFIAKLYASF